MVVRSAERRHPTWADLPFHIQPFQFIRAPKPFYSNGKTKLVRALGR